jgi:hypothetical protein
LIDIAVVNTIISIFIGFYIWKCRRKKVRKPLRIEKNIIKSYYDTLKGGNKWEEPFC